LPPVLPIMTGTTDVPVGLSEMVEIAAPAALMKPTEVRTTVAAVEDVDVPVDVPVDFATVVAGAVAFVAAAAVSTREPIATVARMLNVVRRTSALLQKVRGERGFGPLVAISEKSTERS